MKYLFTTVAVFVTICSIVIELVRRYFLNDVDAFNWDVFLVVIAMIVVRIVFKKWGCFSGPVDPSSEQHCRDRRGLDLTLSIVLLLLMAPSIVVLVLALYSLQMLDMLTHLLMFTV